MPSVGDRERALEPEDLGRLFLERARSGDVGGVVTLYEASAILVSNPGPPVVGHTAIRQFYEGLLANRPQFVGDVRPGLRHGDLALTSTGFDGDATAEIARRQADGTWLWVLDQPNVVVG